MLNFWRKNISSIRELEDVIYEGQSIFEVLQDLDEGHKEHKIKAYINGETNTNCLHLVLLNSYELSQLSISIVLKKFVLSKKKIPQKTEFVRNKNMQFTMECSRFSRDSTLVLLQHYSEDSVEEVVYYASRYIHTFLERKLSVWEKFLNYCKNIWNKIR